MSHMTMSLPALYDYAKSVQNIDIFELLNVPASLNRDDLIDRILFRSAPFECTYTDPVYLHAVIGNWSNVHARTFEKWADALAINYDPLNNYDRTETMTESGLENRIRKDDRSAETSNRETVLGSDISGTKTDSTTTNSVSAFDSAGFSDADKSVIGSGSGTTDTNLQDTTGKENVKTGVNENENTLNSRSHSLRAFGNIGVTSSQELLRQEMDVAAWNIYDHITDLFLDEFCVLLY